MTTKNRVKQLNCPDFFDKYPKTTGPSSALTKFESLYGYLNSNSEELKIFNEKELDCRKKRAKGQLISPGRGAPNKKSIRKLTTAPASTSYQVEVVKRPASASTSTATSSIRRSSSRHSSTSSVPIPSTDVYTIEKSKSLTKEETPIELELPVKRQSQEVKKILDLTKTEDNFKSFLQSLDNTSSLVFNKIMDGLSSQKLLNLINDNGLTKKDKPVRQQINILQKRILDDYLANHYQIKINKQLSKPHVPGLPHPPPYYDYECLVDNIKFKAVLGPNDVVNYNIKRFIFDFVFEPIKINESIYQITIQINLQKIGGMPLIRIKTIYENNWSGPFTVPTHIFQSLLRITYITFMIYWDSIIKKDPYYKRASHRLITDQIYNTGTLNFVPIFRRHYSLLLKNTPFPKTNEVLANGIQLQPFFEGKPNPLGIVTDKPYYITPYHSYINSDGAYIIKSLIRFGGFANYVSNYVYSLEIIYDGASITIKYDSSLLFKNFFQMMKLVDIDETFIDNLIFIAVALVYTNLPSIPTENDMPFTVQTLQTLLDNVIVEFNSIPSANPNTTLGLIT